ncbi:MAG: DUF3365 domain-containing protein [Halopseudomonas aestusnigri]
MHAYASSYPHSVKVFSLGLLAITIAILLSTPPAFADTDEEIAISVATLLRSARAVISDKQKHINTAEIGDKGVTADLVISTAKKNYLNKTGTDIDAIDRSTLHGQLVDAELLAIKEVMDEAQTTINEEGVSLKGFLPAVFARLVTQRFKTSAGGKATIKLTAPKDYVRNRANRPDKWEQNIIQEMFRSPDHPTGQHFSESADVKGKAAFRLILPEYYKESCLGCHGDPKGERDITGGKKEGGKLGELGGAISVVIFH